MLITRKSELTGIERTLDLNVTQEELDLYYTGEIHIQYAFLKLNADDREFIKTGITKKEWDEAFR